MESQIVALFEQVSGRGGLNRNVRPTRLVEQSLIPRLFADVAVDDQATGLKASRDKRQTVVMVAVGMGDDQAVKPPDAFSPQKRGNQALAGIEAFGLVAAAVEENVFAVRQVQQSGRPLDRKSVV